MPWRRHLAYAEGTKGGFVVQSGNGIPPILSVADAGSADAVVARFAWDAIVGPVLWADHVTIDRCAVCDPAHPPVAALVAGFPTPRWQPACIERWEDRLAATFVRFRDGLAGAAPQPGSAAETRTWLWVRARLAEAAAAMDDAEQSGRLLRDNLFPRPVPAPKAPQWLLAFGELARALSAPAPLPGRQPRPHDQAARERSAT